METVDRSAGIAINAGLGAVFAVGLAATAYLLIDSWGGAYWVFNCVVGVVVSTLALLRRRWRAATATAGLAVATAALVVSLAAGLPQEPGPVTALALSVLVGSAIRRLAVPWAGGVAAGGLGVVVGAWLSGSDPIAVFATAGWVAAVATGMGLRAGDRSRRPTPVA